ncbi:MAG: AMP-binding protein [Alphaproteobacteria bacterium]
MNDIAPLAATAAASSPVAWLTSHARARPLRPFLVLARDGRWWQFTWTDALNETRRWAAMLAARGVTAGDHVFIALEHRHEIYFAFLGAGWLGAVPTVIPFPTPKQDPALYWAEYAAMLAAVAPRAVVTWGANLEPLVQVLEDPACALIDVDDLPADVRPPPPAHPSAPDEPAVLQFSSGTTGRRKGIVLSHRLVGDHLQRYAAALGFDEDDRVASWLPLYHDMGLIAAFLLPLHRGATVVAIDPFAWVARPSLLLEAIERFAATFVWMPNFGFRHIERTMPEGRRFRLESVRAFVSSAETCRAETIDSFVAAMAGHGVRPAQMTTSYGMAETVLATTQFVGPGPPRRIHVDGPALDVGFRVRVVDRASPGARTLISCGPPLDGIELRIAVARPGADAGEIQLRGLLCFHGYHRNAAATAASFEHGWYRTGDIGFLHEGELFVCGRAKELVIVNGRNFYASDIEVIAGAVAGVRPGRAAAFGIDDAEGGSERLVVLVEPFSGGDEKSLARAVREAVAARLDVTPHTVAVVPPESLVKTTSGKMNRQVNRERFLAERRS